MAYPTQAETASALSAIGVSVDAAVQTKVLNAVIAEWERRTGWLPFIKDGTDRTRFYDPPRRSAAGMVLDLESGLLTLTSLTAGALYDGTGGTELDAGVHFVLEQYASAGGTDGRPWTRIRFIEPPYGNAVRSIIIVGKFGYAATCPADVYQCILDLVVARLAAKASATGYTGSIKRIKEIQVEVEYSPLYTASGASVAGSPQGQFDDCVARHRRVFI